MPRSNDVYAPPSGTTGVPQTPISSASYNAFVADLTADLNAPRPIVAGGTGASTSQGAIDNIFDAARTIKDDKLLIVDPSDTTKRARIDAGNVTAGQTRVLTLPDADLGGSSIEAWRSSLDVGYKDATERAAFRSSLHIASAVETKSGGYTAVAADRGKLLVFTAAATLSLTAAATLTGDWFITVKATSGDVVIDPDSSETIDGATTVTVPSGYGCTIWCNGTAFYTDLRPRPITKLPYDSGELAITTSGSHDLTHGLGGEPSFVTAELICKTAQAGYSAGAVVELGAFAPATASTIFGHSIEKSGTKLFVSFGSNSSVYYLHTRGGGATVSLTNTNWRLRVRAWL